MKSNLVSLDLPWGLPQGFLLLSHDWYVRRSSCPPPHEYGGKIHLGRSCGCWWNLILILMIIFSHCFWEKCASCMEFCTCLTPFISLTSSLKLTWLQFSHYLACIRRTQSPSCCACIVERSSNGAYASKCPWVPWWLGAHDGCMVCSVPYFVVQAVSYCMIKHVTSGSVTIHLLSEAGFTVTPYTPPSALTTAFACSRA